MQVTATLSNLRIAPRKVRRVAELIRGRTVVEAQRQLGFALQRPAKPLLKLLNSAVANADNRFQLKARELKIEKMIVDGGPFMKRTFPRARGRADVIRKRTSHVTIYLSKLTTGAASAVAGGTKARARMAAKRLAVKGTVAKPMAKRTRVAPAEKVAHLTKKTA